MTTRQALQDIDSTIDSWVDLAQGSEGLCPYTPQCIPRHGVETLVQAAHCLGPMVLRSELRIWVLHPQVQACRDLWRKLWLRCRKIEGKGLEL